MRNVMRTQSTQFIVLGILMLLSSCTLQPTTEPERYALVFGVNDYPADYNDLSGAVNDAESIHRVLESRGFNSQVFTNQNATRQAMEEEISALESQLSPGDMLLLYYAGHGIQGTIGDEYDEFIIPALTQNAGLSEIRDQVINSRDLKTILSGLSGVEIVLIFDACNTGGFVEQTNEVINTLPRNYSPLPYIQEGSGYSVPFFSAVAEFFKADSPTRDDPPPPEIHGITAAGPSEESWEFSSRGVFTTAFVDGIESGRADVNRDNRITLDEIYIHTFNTIQNTWNSQYGATTGADYAFLPHRTGNPYDLILIQEN